MAVEYARSRAQTRTRRREQAEQASLLRRIDWLLLVGTAALLGYGLWALAGITRDDVAGDGDYFVVRQSIYAAFGALAFVVALLVDPDVYRQRRTIIFGGLVVMLLVVLTPLGMEIRGSQRWIDVGFFQLQPSEFGKVAVVLFLAGVVADRGKRISEARSVLTVVGLALIPIVLVYLEPDFGTSLVYCAALAGILFVAATRWTHLVALAAGTAVVLASIVWILPTLGVTVLKDYQLERLTAFRNPDVDRAGTAYNLTQSITAVGAGGLDGRGVEGATQTNLDYLPEHATDFVFASLAEQRGFIGASLLLLLYLLVIWRGVRIISIARDSFSALVAAGIVVALLFQVFVNIGMTMGIAPITGIPLPFVSVGGSSLISNLIAFGILQAIHARGRAKPVRRSAL